MTQSDKAMRILSSTPGVVALAIFDMHGIGGPSLRTAIHRIRKDGHAVDTVTQVGYRLRRIPR